MYFENFPKFVYEFNVADKTKAIIVSDITRNVRFRKEMFANISLYDEYDIEDGDTPEIIAEKFYGNAQYHWIVMLVNDRYDYIGDFPMSYTQLVKYAEDKYGVGNLYDVHHYENPNGLVVNQDDPSAGAVTNIQYEERVNESKRRIKIVSPELVAKVLKQFNDLL